VNTDIHLKISSFEEYTRHVALQSPLLYDFGFDMMPYTDDGDRYFTGQFSSRPAIKAGLRKAS
jgi:hypothetical protein